MSNTAAKKDLANIEHEALKLFLESVKKELNDGFSFFSASADYSASLPQLIIRGNGKI